VETDERAPRGIGVDQAWIAAPGDGNLLFAVLAQIPPWLAALAGLVSFLSPCVLPLVPAYIAYLGGRAGDSLARTRLAVSAGAFVGGLTVVFVLFFYAYATTLAGYRQVLAPIAGAVVILFALQSAGLIRIQALLAEGRVIRRLPEGGGILGGLVLGLGFALGWTPCIGPTLGAILTAAVTVGPSQRGLLLVLAYCFGLGIPFLAIAVLFEWAAPAVRAVNRRRRAIDLASAGILTVMGLLLMANQLTWLTAELNRVMPEWITTRTAL
jgi:cytochrome c-type biogenesis protein